MPFLRSVPVKFAALITSLLLLLLLLLMMMIGLSGLMAVGNLSLRKS